MEPHIAGLVINQGAEILVLAKQHHLHWAAEVRVDSSKVSGSDLMPRLERCSDHFCLDAGSPVQVLCITLYVIKAKDRFLLNHLFQDVLPRMGESLVDEIE